MAITPENRMEQILNGESITPENRAEYFVKEAIDNAGSGSDLPTPGTAGNVLTSTGDGWESAPPQGGEPLHVAISYDGDLGEFKATESVADILAATANAGVLAYFDTTPLIIRDTTSDAVQFMSCIADSGSILTITGVDKSPDEWTADELKYPPKADSHNNGKILGVNNGEYAFVNALPLIVHGEVNASAATITDSGLTLADIYNAAEAGRSVYYECSLDTNSKTRLSLAGRSLDNGAYELTFTAPAITSNAPAVIAVTFDGTGGTFEIAIAQ